MGIEDWTCLLCNETKSPIEMKSKTCCYDCEEEQQDRFGDERSRMERSPDQWI